MFVVVFRHDERFFRAQGGVYPVVPVWEGVGYGWRRDRLAHRRGSESNALTELEKIKLERYP